ncbi:MAG: zinc-ribbon domain-containing protein [Deltaproteobacteria bacterium]|nr:zinc-ribbon domain-containing protein [Deltaproteobacteria bacterium]
MVITCPNCKRRFNLPMSLVRSRNTKLKCSKCKATFAQDLRELIGVPAAKLTEEDERLIASLPATPPPVPKAPPTAPRLPPGARPPASPGPVPARSDIDTAKQPIFSPTATVGEPPSDFDDHAPTKQMSVVTSRRTTKKTPSIPPVAPPPAPGARPAAAAPPVAPPPAPPLVPPRTPPRPPAAPAAPPRVIDGYESYGEAPAIDSEHEEALARADAAHAELETARRAAEQAEAEARARADAAARAAVEAARAQAAVDAALDEAMREAAAEQARAAAQAAEAQRRQAEEAALDAQRARESYVDQERAVEQPATFEAGASDRPPVEFDRPPVEGGDVPIDVPLDEGPATPAPRPAPVTDPHQRALDMFGGGLTSSGRIVLTTMADVDDVLELSDEELPSRWRWVGLPTGALLVLLLVFLLFVLARNSWRLDLANFGGQIKYAFGLGGPVQDDRNCLAASARLPVLVRGQDGVMVVVRGTINNFCQRSIAGAEIRCTLDGPGGPWTDAARPFSSSGASDLTEESLAERTTGSMASEIGRRENSAGVVLPGATHEFWCTFPSAAGSDNRASRFRSSFEVTVP